MNTEMKRILMEAYGDKILKEVGLYHYDHFKIRNSDDCITFYFGKFADIPHGQRPSPKNVMFIVEIGNIDKFYIAQSRLFVSNNLYYNIKEFALKYKFEILHGGLITMYVKSIADAILDVKDAFIDYPEEVVAELI